MELFFNECSLHGQFQNIQEFVFALDELMVMRQTARKYGRELYCHRSCPRSSVTQHLTLPEAINRIEKSKAKVLMAWFGQTGPFWDDAREHSPDELFESNGKIVSDTAIGECAHLRFANKLAQLTSVTPSDWNTYLLDVNWLKDDHERISVAITNHVSVDTLELALQSAEPPLQSWDQFRTACLRRYGGLYFSDEAFSPLHGKPFVACAARGLLDLLDVLSRYKASHQPGTGRSPAGHDLYQEFFTGGRAWFSDSSDSEKVEFKDDLTFPHPEKSGRVIFAPYHGKVQTPQMRIHFSWPVSSDTPLYVLYIGDKITKY